MAGVNILPIRGEGDRLQAGGGGYRPRGSAETSRYAPVPSVTPSARHLPGPGRI